LPAGGPGRVFDVVFLVGIKVVGARLQLVVGLYSIR
jgi:hypothetical protein